MVSRVNGTHRFAWRVAAVLTHHRHKTGLEVGASAFSALVVPLDADPRHLAAAEKVRSESGPVRQNLSSLPVGANGWNVVLGVAGTHARSTSSAPGEIDGHRPPPLRHAAPVIWIVHALVLRLGIALLALSIIRDGRPKPREESVIRVAGHLFAVLCATFRTLTRRRLRSAVLCDFRYVFSPRVMARASRLEVSERDRLSNSASVLPRGPFGSDDLRVAACFGDSCLGRHERYSSGAA